MRVWSGLVACLALAGCLSDPELKEGAPDGSQRLDGAVDGAPADQAPTDIGVTQDAEPMLDEGAPTDDGVRPDEGVLPDEGVADLGADGGEACEPGASEACGSDVGACVPGMRFCQQDGQWSTCFDAVEATPETCDGVDNDCDGTTDEDSAEPCGSDIGACALGERACVDGVLGACEGAVLPAVEICNGIDDNCDGVIDEQLSRACGTNQGICSPGVERCEGGAWGACDAAILPGDQPEDCDGGDENCDGVEDEGCACVDGARRPCGSDVGACSQGEQACDNGVWGACMGATGPSGEICDEVDNDCNGAVDDVPGVGEACTVGVGACRADGVIQCNPAGPPRCDADPGVPTVETCNRIDDDCDGAIDDGIAAVDVSVSIGTAAVRAPSRPAIVPIDGGYAMLWLAVDERAGDDVGVRYGTFDDHGRARSAAVWVQEPNGDLFPAAVALADDGEDGLAYAIAMDGLGGPEAVVGRLSLDGQVQRSSLNLRINDVPERMALAVGGGRYAVVWDEPTQDPPSAFVLITDQLSGQGEGVRLTEASAVRAPAVAWDGEAFGVAYTELRGLNAAVAMTRYNLDGRPLATAVIQDVAVMPNLRWVPSLSNYALTWVTQGRSPDLVFALVDTAFERQADTVVESLATFAWPVLAIKPGLGRQPPKGVAVVWQSGPAGAEGNLWTRTVAPGLGAWRAVGRPEQLDGLWGAQPALTWHPQLNQFAVAYGKPAQLRSSTLLKLGPMVCESAP